MMFGPDTDSTTRTMSALRAPDVSARVKTDAKTNSRQRSSTLPEDRARAYGEGRVGNARSVMPDGRPGRHVSGSQPAGRNGAALLNHTRRSPGVAVPIAAPVV